MPNQRPHTTTHQIPTNHPVTLPNNHANLVSISGLSQGFGTNAVQSYVNQVAVNVNPPQMPNTSFGINAQVHTVNSMWTPPNHNVNVMGNFTYRF